MPEPQRIDPAKLIDAAYEFTEHHGGAQGRPRMAWLRRAVSTAYYALFHHLSFLLVRSLLSETTLRDQLSIARSIDHGALKKVCEWVANPNQAPPHSRELVESLGASPIADLALAFVDLYQARRDADYNHLAGFSKAATLNLIETAQLAMATIDAAPLRDRQAFLALVALQTKLQ